MNELLDNFLNHPLTPIFCYFFALLGVILAIVFYVKSKKKRKPWSLKRSFNIISDKIKKIGKINITYDKKPVDNLTVTKIAFWNGGNETINFSDFAKNDRLRITPEENIQIFDAKIIFVSNKVCSPVISMQENEIFINFDFFDFKQGFIVQLTHSGKSSKDLSINGTVKGSGKVKHREENFGELLMDKILSSIPIRNKGDIRIFRNLFGWVILIIGIIVLIIGYLKLDNPNRIIASVLGITYGLIGFLTIMMKNSIPKGFNEIFNQ